MGRATPASHGNPFAPLTHETSVPVHIGFPIPLCSSPPLHLPCEDSSHEEALAGDPLLLVVSELLFSRSGGESSHPTPGVDATAPSLACARVLRVTVPSSVVCHGDTVTTEFMPVRCPLEGRQPCHREFPFGILIPASHAV
jgi:hypothetical protein